MVITSLLKTQTRSDIKDALELLMLYGAIGTGNSTPAAGDTALDTEVFRDTLDDFDKSAADTVVASLRVLTTEANGNTIQENGLFQAAAAGNMWTRNVLTAIAKTNDITLYLDTSIKIEVIEV